MLALSQTETAKHPHEETMFFWTGRCEGDTCRVTGFDVPAEISRSAGRVLISRTEAKRLGREWRRRGEILLAQVHTHPDEIPLSWIDEEEAADQGLGALAVVVFHYGNTRWSPTKDTAIYERSEAGEWPLWSGTLELAK